MPPHTEHPSHYAGAMPVTVVEAVTPSPCPCRCHDVLTVDEPEAGTARAVPVR